MSSSTGTAACTYSPGGRTAWSSSTHQGDSSTTGERESSSGHTAPPSGLTVELEQAYPDRLTAMRAVMDAAEAHMARRYGLGANGFTIEEKC